MKRIAALALAASLLTLTACSSKNDADDAPVETAALGVAVQVETVESATISNQNRVSGRVAAETQTTVMVGTSAQVTAVYVEVGDTVQAGQRLCTLDVSSTLDSYNAAVISRDSAVRSYNDQGAVFDSQIELYDSQIALADTQIESLNAQIEVLTSQISLAEKNLRDLEALLAIGAAAQIEVDQARLSLDSARVSLTQAQMGVDQAASQKDQLQLAKLTAQTQKTSTLSQLEAGIQSYQANVDQLSAALENVDGAGNVLAPVSGAIISLNAVEKGMVAPTAPVAVIEEAQQMKVLVSVSEAVVPKIAVGDTVDVVISAVGASYEGAIRNIDRSANFQTGLYAVTVTVPGDVAGLLPGMFADVTFRTDTSHDALVVPTQAILTSGGVQYVFVVEDGQARYIEVTTGLVGDGVTEVLTGLSQGQQLVTVGQTYLHDGDAVRIVSEGE